MAPNQFTATSNADTMRFQWQNNPWCIIIHPLTHITFFSSAANQCINNLDCVPIHYCVWSCVCDLAVCDPLSLISQAVWKKPVTTVWVELTTLCSVCGGINSQPLSSNKKYQCRRMLRVRGQGNIKHGDSTKDMEGDQDQKVTTRSVENRCSVPAHAQLAGQEDGR